MQFPRSSGLLLHPTSLSGRFGIGDLGHDAYRFVDFLVEAEQQLWQVLPLGPTGYGNSPYMAYSALAGNPMLVSPELLREEGWLTDADLGPLAAEPPSGQVSFERVAQLKDGLFHRLHQEFRSRATPAQREDLARFCAAKAAWLDDFALFMALKRHRPQTTWNEWEPELAGRDDASLQAARRSLVDDVEREQLIQFHFFRQWTRLREYANQRGVSIVGDIPIYVAHDSSDVWANPGFFALDEESGEPAFMAGVPPDYFSATGQLWGNPVYDWDALSDDRFGWWVHRFRALLELVDIVRIDHFRGFESFWQVPRGHATAEKGEWSLAPGKELFDRLREELGEMPIIAEDLGIITPEVEALRDSYDFPGMKVLQFAFGGGASNPYLPFNLVRNCIFYTGTHDNDTTAGWLHQLNAEDRAYVLEFLGGQGPHGLHWDLIRQIMASVANQTVVPVQDLLGLGSEARMNTPSKPTGNWGWRLGPGALTSEVAERLKRLTRLYGRAPRPSAAAEFVDDEHTIPNVVTPLPERK